MSAHPNAKAFRAKWRGRAPSAEDEALEATLAEAVAAARAALPELPEPNAAFVQWLAERAPASGAPAAALQKLRVDALYLTWACAQGDRAALDAFEKQYMHQVPKWISGLRPEPALVSEVEQELREKLFLGRVGKPKILQYGGEGTLENWLRTAALRTALNLLDARKGRQTEDELRLAAGAARYEPEIDYIKDRYRADFARAFHDAFSELPQRTRALLRFQHVERLTPERIGVIYDVHRTTAARWLAESHQAILEGTRTHLKARLKLTSGECESLVALLQSRLDFTLSKLFQSAIDG